MEKEFLHHVEFADDADGAALRIRPEGKGSPVIIDPELSSGAATVRGIRSEVLAEQVDAGENVEDVASEFGVGPNDVRSACSYEWGKARRVA